MYRVHEHIPKCNQEGPTLGVWQWESTTMILSVKENKGPDLLDVQGDRVLSVQPKAE